MRFDFGRRHVLLKSLVSLLAVAAERTELL
jgi:hypothetical protein